MGRTHHTAGILVMSFILLATSIAVAGEPGASIRDEFSDAAAARGEYSPPAWPEPPNTGAMFFQTNRRTRIGVLAASLGMLRTRV